MPEAAKKETTSQAGDAKGKGDSKDDKPKMKRTNFSDMWPEDAKVTLNVKENPKKEGSAARERFQHYFKSKTVGDYLAAGGTYQDIAYDVGRAFVAIG